MNDGRHVPEQEAHGELSLARVALAENDLRRAAGHVAAAMAFAPALPETHELLAVVAVRSADPLSLFPLGDHTYVGSVVAHAHLLARTDPGRALMLLAQATAFDPRQPWADVSWVRAADLRRHNPDDLARVLVALMRGLGDPASPRVRVANQVYLDLAHRAVTAHPDHALLHGSAAAIGRRLGETALAVRWGERAVALGPSKLTSVWFAYALKADGQLDRALEVMAAARRQNPLDFDLSADMANWLADVGRLDEALALVEGAVRIDPGYDCAVHTAHRLRFLRDHDPVHLIELADFIRDNPITSHEHSDLADSCRGRPWLGQVPAEAEPWPDQPTPAVASPGAARRLAELASPTWPHPVAAYDHALSLGELAVDDLLALLARPPSRPERYAEAPVGWWERGARAFAALGILHSRHLSSGHPGDTTAQRALLGEIAAGADHGAAEAALFALSVAAWLDPQCRGEVADTVESCFLAAVSAAESRGGPSLGSLAQLVLIVPGRSPRVGEVAAGIVAAGRRPDQVVVVDAVAVDESSFPLAEPIEPPQPPKQRAPGTRRAPAKHPGLKRLFGGGR